MRTENTRNKTAAASTQSGTGNFLKPLIKGTLMGAVVSLVFCLALAVLLIFKDLPKTFYPYMTTGIITIGTFFGGVSAGKSSGTKGLFYGVCVALVLIIVVFIIGITSNVNNPLPQKLIQVAFMAIAGSVGGVIGCNKRQKR